MDTLKTIKIDGKLYYDANEIKDIDPIYFRSCGSRIRNVIREHDLIYITDYIYCNKKTGDWNLIANSDKPAVKDRLFLRKKWVTDHVPKFTGKNEEECNQLYKVQPAPPVLELTSDEQFCDGEWTYPIEVRGKRNIDECYFSAKDIGDLFELADIQKQLAHVNSSYTEGVDYVKFLVPNGNKKNNVRYYLTYNGVMHAIYASHNPIARSLQRWATTTLFTLHVGTLQNKVDLFTGLIGTNGDLARKVFGAISNPVSCVYFIAVGFVDDLRSTFDLSSFGPKFNNHIVCKYGRTCDMKRRLGELTLKYKTKNPKINLELLYCSFIDDTFATNAENDIREIFNTGFNKIETIDEKELVVIDKKRLNNIKRQYVALDNEYGKRYDEIKNKYNDEIKTLTVQHNNEIRVQESETHKQEMAKVELQVEYERQLREKDKIIYEKELQIAKLENENLKLRLQFNT